MEIRRKNRLDRVDHNRAEFCFSDVLKHTLHRSLAENEEIRSADAEPFGSHLGLFSRLLPGHVKHLEPLAGKSIKHLQKEGRLSDSRIPANQDHRSEDDPTAQDPVKLSDPTLDSVLVVQFDIGDRTGWLPHSKANQ